VVVKKAIIAVPASNTRRLRNLLMSKPQRSISRPFVALVMAVLTLGAAGCGGKMSGHSSSFMATEYARLDESVAASTERYVAERHKLEIFTSESRLQKSWELAVAFCGTIQCQVLSSSITTRAGDSVPSGSISLRVSPEDLNRLLAYVEKFGKVAEHTTERQDETTAVVDTEAKIKNLTGFRDSLRAMLAKPSATVKDLVEIQQQLTDTQSQLDSETAQRKILANETEKIAVEISFVLEGSIGNARGFSQVWNAVRESGDILADSTSSLITTIVAIVPWLILIVPGVWLLAKAWRALKRRRTRNAVPPISTTST